MFNDDFIMMQPVDASVDTIDIFLSSTYEDLKMQREIILKELRRLKWVRVHCMEDVIEGPGSPLDQCLRLVGNSNIFIMLIACKYGTIVMDRQGREYSFTHHEYNRSTSLELYPLIYLDKDECRGISEKEKELLDNFKQKFEKTNWVKYFTKNSQFDVVQKITSALSHAQRQCDGRMWIFVNRPFDNFLNIENIFNLRKCIANDCNISVNYIWLTLRWCPYPKCTLFMVHLPANAMRRYLKMKIWERTGDVFRVIEYHRGSLEIPQISQISMFLVTFIYKKKDILFRLSDIEKHHVARSILVLSPFYGTIVLMHNLNIAFNLSAHHKTIEDKTSKKQFIIKTQERRQRMSEEHFITVDGQPIPLIAFFGTKGGVGKTTIMDKFATIASHASHCPNVLMIDFDIHHRGLTVLRTRDSFDTSCKTIHEYLADPNLAFSRAIDVTPTGSHGSCGKQYLIPSSKLAAEKVFASLAGVDPPNLLERLKNLLTVASTQYRTKLILIDCGPIVDPLTASAAHMSNIAFIIGQNEPISFQALQNYAVRIREFFPEFNASKARVVLNKVRGPIFSKSSIYASIPFTMEVVDYSEGLPNIDEVRLIYLDHCVYGIVKSIFESSYPELVPGPESVLTPNQRETIDSIDQYVSTRWYIHLKRRSVTLYIGIVVSLIGMSIFILPKMMDVTKETFIFENKNYIGGITIAVGILFAIFGAYLFYQLRHVKSIIRLKNVDGYEGLLKLLTSRTGRKKFSKIQSFSNKTDKENK